MNSTLYKAVSFQRPQRLREHLLRRAGDMPLKLRVPKRPFAECKNDEHRPFTRDAVQDLLRRALRIQDVVDRMAHTLTPQGTFECLLHRTPSGLAMLREVRGHTRSGTR